MPPKKAKPKTIKEYLAAMPDYQRSALEKLRKTIRAAAPNAEECLQEHKSELTAYETTKATVRFPLHRKLPPGLIRKLIRARLKKNDARRKK